MYLLRGSGRYHPEIPFSRLGTPRNFGDEKSSPTEKVENYVSFLLLEHQKQEASSSKGRGVTAEDIPWKAISERDRKVVEAHFRDDKSYEEIMKELGLSSTSSVHEIIHGRKGSRVGALKTLQEYAKFQALLKAKGDSLPRPLRQTMTLYYKNYLSIQEIADKKGHTSQWISMQLKNGKKILEST
jgi:predicted DNA-binding protein YlxM (UPF0122 family)